MYFITRTGPFRAFQKRVGNTTFHINSAYVGLEWIARGKGKPDGLDINWTAPVHPRQAVDQARSLLHTAMLSRVVDELDSYLRALADEPWLVLTPEQCDILRRAVTKSDGGAHSITERFLALRLDLDANTAVDMAMVAALVAWRNQTIHVRPADPSGRLRLDMSVEEQLNKGRVMLGKRYGGLDPEIMLGHMRKKRPPKRKEIVGLVSAAQNLTRAIDGTLLRAALSSAAEVENIARAVIATKLCCEGTQNEFKKLWGKNPAARCRRLRAILEEAGFVRSSEMELPGLPSTFIKEIVLLSFDDALRILAATS